MSTLNIDQLLRAAQILEQSATLQQLVQQQQQQQQQLQFCKFGEDYQDKLVMSKMRSVNVNSPLISAATAGGSTGSSRRSTPSGSMFSNCSSTPNSSSPNSPPTTLFLSSSSTMTGGATPPSSAFVRVAHNYAATNDTSDVVCGTTNFAQNLLEQHEQQQQQYHQQPYQSTSAVQHENSASNQFATQIASTSIITPNFNALSHPRNSPSSSSVASMSIRQSRAAHNELEKNRRANLRGYLDKLKSVLPPDSDSTRDTTLSLLTRARNYLRTIKQEKDALVEQKKTAISEFLRLRQELDSITAAAAAAATATANADATTATDIVMSESTASEQIPSVSGQNKQQQSSPTGENLGIEIDRLTVACSAKTIAQLSHHHHHHQQQQKQQKQDQQPLQHRSAFSVNFGASSSSSISSAVAFAGLQGVESDEPTSLHVSAFAPVLSQQNFHSSSPAVAATATTSATGTDDTNRKSGNSQAMSTLVLPQMSSFMPQSTTKNVIDLYMEGLLPALPLLYPYGQLILRKSANFQSSTSPSSSC